MADSRPGEPPLTVEQIADLLRGAEPWLDKRELAQHLSCSVRSIETALAEGLPHAVILGRVKFRVSEVEPWLEAHGHLERRPAIGEEVPRRYPNTRIQGA
jgi:hypothetical protein